MKFEYHIGSAEVDPLKNYKPYSFMCATQEIANIHATSLQFGYNQLIKDDLVWILSRQMVKYLTSPKWDEEISIDTWHKGLDGIFSLRDFIVSNSEGSTMMLSTSSWLLMNIKTRKVQRIDHTISPEVLSTAIKKDAIATPCNKLTSPDSLQQVSQRRVLYSDLDFNLHTNNAKYIEWAFDSIDTDILLHHPIDQYQINYNHEALLGDTITVYTSTLSPSDYFVEGKMEERSIFQVLINLKP